MAQRYVNLAGEYGIFIPSNDLPFETYTAKSPAQYYDPHYNLRDEAAPIQTPKPSGFKLGAKSQDELIGVKKELVRCVELAITMTTQDFTVYDGIRSIEEQKKHVANGTSKTLKSKHLDGLAVDLVPWVGGKPVWDWSRIYPIAKAMDDAATKLGYADKIRWGGAWDRVLSDFGGDVDAYKRECELYAQRHLGKDFLDGPHFEWVG
jgi:peptidoglycan L-alanyl-D-glutamate endopeptidase CwlK